MVDLPDLPDVGSEYWWTLRREARQGLLGTRNQIAALDAIEALNAEVAAGLRSIADQELMRVEIADLKAEIVRARVLPTQPADPPMDQIERAVAKVNETQRRSRTRLPGGNATMRLRSLKLDDDELPETVEFSMTRDEALLLAVFLGATSPSERDAIMPGFGNIGSGIYDCVTSMFNLFWDDGVRDAQKAFRARARVGLSDEKEQ